MPLLLRFDFPISLDGVMVVARHGVNLIFWEFDTTQIIRRELVGRREAPKHT
jgi:hypothetical protein